jgi:hypothetical protein
MAPITCEHVARAQARAYAADEVADAAGLLLAESLVTGIGHLDQLLRDFRTARAAATYAWCVYSDALDQAERDRGAVPA